MALDAAEIATVSRLLDEALALPASGREAWLAALPAEHRHLAATLGDMLAGADRLPQDDPLGTLPRMAAGDESVARPGDCIGPYRLRHEIGRGGMGSVWLAERADGSFRRQVALKLPRLAWEAGLAGRMARERDIGALLEHPNIARLYDAGIDDRGRPYLALEYIEGQPIDAWCEARALDVPSRLRLFVQVARAVAYAHGRLVVHRDLKPSNVLVTPDGQAHLLDFGIAKLLHEAGDEKLTQQQGRVLTPHYASPEQLAGEPITVQSDVYSLGVLLYELLTGTLPIAPKRATLGAVEEAVLLGDVPLASRRVTDRAVARALRGDIDAILGKALQREPARRYATADAMALDIEQNLKGETVGARPDSAGYRLRKALRRHWVGASAAAAVLVAVLGGAGVAVVQAQRAARSAERERVVKEFVADVFRANSRVDLGNAAIRPASAQALLEGGARLIQQRFGGQPDLQAEIFGVVGRVFSDMGAYRLAVEYSTRRIEALVLLKAEPMEQAGALLELAQALFNDQRYADAELRARRAHQLSAGSDAQRLDAAMLLARIHWSLDRSEDAASMLREVDAALARQAAGTSTTRAWSTYLHAQMQAWQNHLDSALPVFQQAIDSALLAEGPMSPVAAEMHLGMALRLAQTTHQEQTRSHLEAAVTVLRQLGGAHAVRADYATASLAERRHLGGRQIKASEAIADLEQSRARLSASPLPIPETWLPQIDFWIGAVRAGAGDITAGLHLMEKSEPLLSSQQATPTHRRALAIWLGEALQDAGRHDLADRFLKEALQSLRLPDGNLHPYAAFDIAMIAWNHLMAGRFREASAVLDAAPRFEPMRGEGTDPDRYNRLIDHARAHVRLASGDVAGALALLDRSAPPSGSLVDDLVYFNGLWGEASCATSSPRTGLAVLKTLLSDSASNDLVTYAPWLARRRAVTGLCALRAGERRLAKELAAQARAAFIAQPGVSPYYKAALGALERELGLKLPPV